MKRLRKLLKRRNFTHNKKPILIKISPDLNDDQLRDIALISLANGIDGLILTNTTINRPDILSQNKTKN